MRRGPAGPRRAFESLEPRSCRAAAVLAVHIHDPADLAFSSISIATPAEVAATPAESEAVAATLSADIAETPPARPAGRFAKVRATSIEVTSQARVRISTSADESSSGASAATPVASGAAGDAGHVHDAALLIIVRDDSAFGPVRGGLGHVSCGPGPHDAVGGEMAPGMAGHVPQAMAAPGMLSTPGYHGRRGMETSEDLDLGVDLEVRPPTPAAEPDLEPQLEPELEPALEPSLEVSPEMPEQEEHSAVLMEDSAVERASADLVMDADVFTEGVEPPDWLGRLVEGVRWLLGWVWG